MANVSEKKIVEKIKAHILCSIYIHIYIYIYIFENRAVYEIMWGEKKHGTARQTTDNNIIGSMRVA